MKTVIIGRSPDNNIVINDPYANPYHCQISQYDDRSFRLLDRNSQNGTFVNGRKITDEIILQPTDVIKIGNTTLPWQGYFAGGISSDTIADGGSPMPAYEPPPSQYNYHPPHSNYPKPQKKSNKWLVVVAIVAVLAAAGGLIWFLLPSSKGFKTEEEVGKKAFEMIKNIDNISEKKFVDFFVSSIKAIDKDFLNEIHFYEDNNYTDRIVYLYRGIKDWARKENLKDMKYLGFERDGCITEEKGLECWGYLRVSLNGREEKFRIHYFKYKDRYYLANIKAFREY